MPVTLTTLSLDERMPPGWKTTTWTIGPVAPMTLTVVGNARARQLIIAVELMLIGSVTETPAWRLRGQLVSNAWVPTGALPPVVRPDDSLTATSPNSSDAELDYSFTLTQSPVRVSGAAAWLKYLQPATPSVARAPDTHSVGPPTLTTALPRALQDWLTDSFPAATVAAACETACHGPVGHFGPVESYVLERSGQADLAIEATLLGSTDDALETGGEASTSLSLYGERFGLWLLQRRSVKVLKLLRQGARALRQAHSMVAIAHTAEALIAQSELSPMEKRLFQAVGILPHATLWSKAPATGANAENASASESAAVTTLDLSDVPDRSRRHLQAITQLAQQGKLDATDTDLLLKTARQMSKVKAVNKAMPRDRTRTIPRG